MTHRIAFALMMLAAAPALSDMLRVTGVRDGCTLIVDRAGTAQPVRLTGLRITDEIRARELLEWTTAGAWILAEADPGGGYRVWRSPDALFVNRELVVRGYAKPTLPGIAPETQLMVTYLGVVDPAGVQGRVSSAPAPRSSNGTSRRSSAPRRPRAKPRPISARDH